MSDEQREEERAILYRLDERTERMDARIERMALKMKAHDEILDYHDDRIQRNTTILNAITFGIGSLVTALMAKIQGLIKF